MRLFIILLTVIGQVFSLTRSAEMASLLGPEAYIKTDPGGAVRMFAPARDNQLNLSPRLSPHENARSLLQRHPELFDLDRSDAILEVEQTRGNKTYLIFRQILHQVPVFQSKIDFRFQDNANLMLVRNRTFPLPELNTNPLIPSGVALDIARLETDFARDRGDVVVQAPRLYIYAAESETYSYRLGWHLKLQIHHPPSYVVKRTVSFYEIWIDAMTGEMFSLEDRTEELTISGRISAMVKDVPYGLTTERPLADIRVQIDGVGDTYSDLDGYYELEAGTTPRLVTVDFTGNYLAVNTQNAADAVVSATVTPGDTFNVLFDDLSALPSERDTYFHANLIHRWITSLDNDFTGADYAMPATVNIGSEDPLWPCNAYWDGTGINMFSAGGGCSDTGEMADVIYHEYQHGLTQFAYAPFSSPYESGLGEGLSDYAGMTLRNSPCLGDAFFGSPGGCLRHGENTRQYPGNECNGEVHCLGEISMGALWKMRVNLITEIGDSATAIAHSDTLFRWSLFGRPYTIPELLDEILIADDDDGTLLNGTPNYFPITEAFAAHNVMPSIPEYGIAHTPVTNMETNTTPTIIEAIISSIHGNIITSELHYTINSVTQTVAMTAVGNGRYQAAIPVQPPGTIVRYYITASDEVGNAMIAPETAPNQQYFFLIGNLASFPLIYTDDAETDQGWTLGLPSDLASTGLWIQDDPIGTFEGSLPVQPGNDHTPDGITCFITGNAIFNGTNAGENDVDGGQTTLVSPVYDLSGILSPVLTYWYWYSNNLGANPGSDLWRVDITADGQTWVPLEITSESDTAWVYRQFLVEEFITPSTTVQVRFIAEDADPGSLVEAGVDDLEIRSGLALDVEPGDMDFDYELDLFDILTMTDIILSQDGPNGLQTYVGDVNGDGLLNIIDVITLISRVMYP
ncbi:MAG: hypothetical protein ACE5D8_07900 [Fidelibacterota bacterium]